MSSVNITDRLDEVEERILDWDFAGSRDLAQRLLDEPDLADEDRVTARRLLAEALRELGDLAAAYDLAESAATNAARLHGAGHPATIHALAVLAAVRHDYDERDEAERLYHAVLDSGLDEESESLHRAILLARANLALLQRDKGDQRLALTMLNAAYVIHRREYGADDLDTIRIAAELAALHHADGDLNAARRLFTLAHASARARLGSRHAFTKAVEWELAAVEPPMPSAPVSSVPVSAIPVSSGPVSARRPSAPPAQVVVAPPPAAPVPIPAPDPPAWESVVPEGAPPRRVVVPLQAVVAVVVVALLVAGLSIWREVSTGRARDGGAQPSTSGASGAPVVRDLRLQDQGNALSVSWSDPRVTLVVAVSRAGGPAVVLATVPPGTSSYVVRGVEPGVAYCVVVGPVDVTQVMTPAQTVCTGDR
ncbi:tetratricopeptide repeat protein [Dactylosporangium sp. AC04546]|uniref:tetratricopeptide repeat protein n=1 Tax=Dactylosporangium sp. AC04546 TaxID=2862460 RepID=UPI001EDE9DA2|nr:tetratricopeptide repeat protein [Dactylosporangium sp. AC04546]WVK85741.1 tetratricopeptide repeat protein [Dactylosporangium sp. AC04546]